MTRSPDDEEERPVKGGRAAERLREFLAARFGDQAPPVPPDEVEPTEEEPPDDADQAEEEAPAPSSAPEDEPEEMGPPPPGHGTNRGS